MQCSQTPGVKQVKICWQIMGKKGIGDDDLTGTKGHWKGSWGKKEINFFSPLNVSTKRALRYAVFNIKDKYFHQTPSFPGLWIL